MPREDLRRASSSLSLSKLQSPMTTKWLHENYEMSDGVSLPRSSLYSHYLDFCTKNNLQPVNAASFGKIIRHTFPSLKTRRLGTRGQSKYHYYGICVKESSPYHESAFSAVRQSSSGFSQSYSKAEMEERTRGSPSKNQSAASTPGVSESNMLLPDFPSADSIKVQDTSIKEKVKTFLIMYRAHCQRILDTILRANFSEVQNFLIHFWQGMPGHIVIILDHRHVIDLIATCDNILYKAISGVLVPGTLQPLPASLTQAIRQFANQLCSWLEMSLYHLPETLREKKLTVAKAFTQLLRRQTSLSHLAQAARTVLHSTEPVSQMSADLRSIDIRGIIHQSIWTSASQNKEKEVATISKFFKEFSDLLEQQATVDQYAEWVSSLIERCVVKPSDKEEGTFQTCAQTFLLQWSFITSKIVTELTLKSAQSFGSFHLLQMLFDDYIFFLIESHAVISDESEEVGERQRGSYEEYSDGMDEDLAPECMRTFIRRRSVSDSSSSGRGSLPSPDIRHMNSRGVSFSNHLGLLNFHVNSDPQAQYDYARQQTAESQMSAFYPTIAQKHDGRYASQPYSRMHAPLDSSSLGHYSSVTERVNAIMSRDSVRQPPQLNVSKNRYLYDFPDHSQGRPYFYFPRENQYLRSEIRI